MTTRDGAATRIAFFGLGKMGLPMATRLVEAGWSVTGFDPFPAARDAFAAAGGRAVAEPGAAVEGAATLILMLPDGKAVRTLLTQTEGVAGRLASGTLVVDMSSSAPVGTRDLAAELAAEGVTLIDAPVSGGVKRAIDGSLAIMVGGEAEAVARATPLLEVMGGSIFATGPIGSGHAMKALNNYVSAAGLTAACEALRVGRSFGLDPTLMTDILNVSTGRNNSTEVKLKPFVIPQSYTSGFSLALMAKDLRTADDLARHEGVAAPLSGAVSALWAEALAELGTSADHTAIDAFLGRREA
ncbi:NAD(P)-dependent oxidoreductase [Methylobacterium aerolatum]|uniref:3-hydroxyisobutyrate dehydrogenase n=1 Tax=Methylobacterium aerolatum TaxID=418708 RepID=A0ABU0I2A0_9HYPH|nr:NAD(P)-dependent oxidoreductase [Methylobacterium aerolatum]MDQ0448727.1 3-hydroxyisobutyrate dehydrogenase [Methylobacterium aerolatum]GJD34949.1 3-hydroxyisobutyrate dehydrogenase [Methylobacterium aerolatum]